MTNCQILVLQFIWGFSSKKSYFSIICHSPPCLLNKLYLPLNEPFRCLSSLLSPGVWRRSTLASEVTLCNQLTCSSWCGSSQGGSSSSWAWQMASKQRNVKKVSVSGPTLASQAECLKIERCIDGAGRLGYLRPPQRWDSYKRACHCKVGIRSQTMVLPLFTSIQLDHLSGSRDWQRRLTQTVRTATLSSSRNYRWPSKEP